MNYTLRPMKPNEYDYCYSQSDSISGRTGLIGYMRAYFDECGNFCSDFYDYQTDYKSYAFCDEFNELIEMLRTDRNYGSMLKDLSSVKRSCIGKTPIDPYGQEFGFRIDSEQYSYMLRLNYHRGIHNVYCYCYVRRWLERHLENAAKGIRFITPNYKEKFRIEDGDIIRVTTQDDKQWNMVCHYLDDYHFEGYADGRRETYHICQFAEMLEKNGCKELIPLRTSLPARCYTLLEDRDQMVCIRKGEPGYLPVNVEGDRETLIHKAEVENKILGVTEAQKAAMVAGSMFGWAAPAANPKNYDEKGRLLSSVNHDRGECR